MIVVLWEPREAESTISDLLGRTDVSRVGVVADSPGDGDHVDGRR